MAKSRASRWRGCRRNGVLQPFSTARRDIRIDTAVGGAPFPRDATVIYAVKNPRFASRIHRFGIIFKRRLSRDEARLNVIATGIGSGDELVGAAIEQRGGTCLLADVGVGAMVVDFRLEGKVVKVLSKSSDSLPGIVRAHCSIVVDSARLQSVHESVPVRTCLLIPMPTPAVWLRRRSLPCRRGFPGRRFGDVFETDLFRLRSD